MSIQPPQGILNIPNATLRVGKLEVNSTEGLDTVLNNIERNTILLEDTTEYPTTGDPVETEKRWGLKVPNIFVATFEIKGVGSSFNFRNNSNGDATIGYTLTFSGTTLTLKYNNASLTTATIPNLDTAYGKVYLTYEKQYFTVTVDGTRVLTYKDDVTRTPPEGEYANFFTGTGGGFKNLKIVSGHLISDGTSNVSLYGGLAVTSNLEVGQANLFVDTLNTRVGVGTTEPKESLDVVGNMHLTRVSNVSQVSVDSNVVAEYTGPHDRPLRKYPEVALTANDNSSTSGYIASTSTTPTVNLGDAYLAFDGDNTTMYHTNYPTVTYNSDGTYGANSGASKITDVDNVDHDGEWLKIQLPKAIKVEYMKFQARVSYSNRFPNKLSILGSNDNSNWYLLLRDDNVPLLPANPAFHTIQINATTKYKYYVLVIRELSHSGVPSTTSQVSGWELYGHEEGSGSLDTTLKSVYNVPATTGTQLEVYYDAKDLTAMPSIVTDLAGGDQNGIVNGTIGFDSTYKAFTFNGNASNYINAGAVGLTDDAVHTVSLWFKYTGNGTHQAIFSISSNGADETINNAINFLIRSDGTMWFVHWSNEAKTTDVFIEDQWYHVTYTYEGGGATLAKRGVYINGKRIYKTLEQGTDFGDELTLTSPQMIIGKRYFASAQLPFNGSIANFRLYSKALNAGQVQELYDYQKDYFLGSKSQVTLYKGHLGVGVTEPSGQLELAGDERIQEYPPRDLYQYETLVEGHGVFCASWSSNAVDASNDTWYGWRAFDGDPTTNVNLWHSNGGYSQSGTYTTTSIHSLGGYQGEWVRLDIPYEIKLTSFRIRQRSGSNDQAPKSFLIIGSNTGNEWDLVFTIGDAALVNNVSKDFTVNSTKYYKYYALVVTSLAGTGGSAAISELRYFGTPGPTTLDKGSLSLTRSLDVPRVSRYDVDTETPRPEKLLVDFDTTVNNSPTDISGNGNHGTFGGSAYYSSADKAFILANNPAAVSSASTHYIEAELGNSETGNQYHSVSLWVKVLSGQNSSWRAIFESSENPRSGNGSISLYVPGGDDKLVFAHGGSSMYTDTLTNLYFRWHHVVLTYDGANRKMYLDGELIKTIATTTWSGVANMTLRLGKNNATNGNEGCDCHISNFKMYWQTALEPSEVRKLYNLGRTGRSMVISDTAVGIGKAPEAQLDVRGTGGFTGDLTVGGSVGIGTTSPAKKLHVEHYGSAIGDFEGIRIANHASLLHATSRPAYEFVVSDIAAGTGIGASKFAIGYRGTTSASRTDRLVIDNSGNVGIGTTSPSYRFDVADQHGDINSPMVVFRANINGASNGDGNVLRVENAGARTDTELYDATSNGVRQFSVKASGRCEAREFCVAGLSASGFLGGDGGSSDGIFSRPDGQAYISVDDDFYVRDNVDTTSNRRIYFDTNNGNIRYEGNISQQDLDYAELFEWYDGNPNGEDRVGYTVTLVERTNKIKKMEVGDTPLGVVSATPGVIGGQGIHWHGYWEKDDWGRPVYAQQLIRGEPVFNEDGTPKMKRVRNPGYDVTLEESYQPRDKRPEWSCIGLLGQVYIRKECVKSPHWRKIKDVDDVKELWLINTVLPDQNDKERILELETQLGSVLARLDTLESA